MSDDLKNPPAFPASGHPGKQFLEQEGMTLRDYFAAAALTGLVVSNKMDCMNGTQHPDIYADDAYSIADSMLARRVTPTPTPTSEKE